MAIELTAAEREIISSCKNYLLDNDIKGMVRRIISLYDAETCGKVCGFLYERLGTKLFSYANTIPNQMFFKSPIKEVTIPGNIERIEAAAFSGSSVTKVVIEDGVLNIDPLAFENCAGLSQIDIGNSVRDIGDEAFAGCSRLKEILLPDSLTVLGKRLFKDNDSINVWANPRTNATRLRCPKNEIEWYKKHAHRFEGNKTDEGEDK